jgi:predicted DNA-binding transcriptional regulator YafY
LNRSTLAPVRASRLVSLLLLLQTRGRMTAAQLAEALEVSVRTIYRDLEALSAAGVPVYAEAGPNGGCQLLEGYRTRLTGLTAKEAEALFASGVTGPAGELGLGTVLGAAQLKLLAALPAELAERASLARHRFHLDAPRWFRGGRNEPHLLEIAAAVWDDRRITVRYRHPGAAEAVVRHLDPFGLVLKAGIWYLVARRDGELRTYRLSRVEDVTRDDERFERPDDFDLGRFWRETVEHYEASVPALDVTVRASEDGHRGLRRLERESGCRVGTLAPVAGESRGVCTATFEDLDEAYEHLLLLGADVEVIEPTELRVRLAGTAGAMAALYQLGTGCASARSGESAPRSSQAHAARSSP